AGAPAKGASRVAEVFGEALHERPSLWARKTVSLDVPGCLLNNDPIAVGILECAATSLPIRTKRFDLDETGIEHRATPRFPCIGPRYVEDKQVLPRRRRTHRMGSADRELQMEAATGLSK